MARATVPSTRLHDNNKPATYKDLTNAYALDCAIVDANGNQVTDFIGQATTFDHGAKSNVTAAAVQITTNSIASLHGVLIKSDADNQYLIGVGNSDVTIGSTDTTDGFELSAGDGVVMEIDNANKVYVIGNTTTSQRVTWLVI